MLSIEDAAGAVAFYVEAFGAEILHRLDLPGGALIAELAVGGAVFFVTSAAPDLDNPSPEAAGGTTVRLNLVVADPDGFAARAVGAGAHTIFPIADHDYGWRQGRIGDPFGHQWLIGRPLARRGSGVR